MPCDADAATRGIASPVSAEPDDAGLSGSGETMAQVGCGRIGESSDDSRDAVVYSLPQIEKPGYLLSGECYESPSTPNVGHYFRDKLSALSGAARRRLLRSRPFALPLSGNCPVHLSRIHDPYGELLAGLANHLHECKREDRRVGTRVAGHSTRICVITRT